MEFTAKHAKGAKIFYRSLRSLRPLRFSNCTGRKNERSTQGKECTTELTQLEIFDDPNVCYTFHFYKLLLFTHQRAPWVRVAMEYNQPLEYPGTFIGLREFLRRALEYRAAYEWLTDRPLDRALLQEFLQPACDFVRETGRDL